MEIRKDAMVTIHYTLKDESGEVLDSSKGRDPLNFIQGSGQIIPGMEKALEGRAAGDEFSIVVEPEEGYGVRDESFLCKVPKDQFKGIGEVNIGMRFQVDMGEGPHLMSVAAVEEDGVVLDGNHPLADTRLMFDVSVIDVREATREELQGCQDCSTCSGGCQGA